VLFPSSQAENSETLDLPGFGKNSQRADQSTFKRLCTQYNKNMNIRLSAKIIRYRNPIFRVVQLCITFKSRLLKDLLVTIIFFRENAVIKFVFCDEGNSQTKIESKDLSYTIKL
jgi:hypothetical protein